MARRLSFSEKSPCWGQVAWDSYQMGLSTRDIAAEHGVSPGVIERMVNQAGGIRPPRWKDPERFLQLEERKRIRDLVSAGLGVTAIAREIGRDKSTVSRELRRGSPDGFRSHYSPGRAHSAAWEARRRPKPLKIPNDPRLREAVQTGLDQKLSPEQIVGRLRREHPHDPGFVVSHETIYKTIYLQARGGLKREVAALTRTGRTIRRPHRSSHERRGRIQGMVSIWDRPAEALDRLLPGHWEGDLIIGKDGKSAIGTVVERYSNYLLLVHLDPEKNRVEGLCESLTGKLRELPATLRRTLTWDQGSEMRQHQKIAELADIDIYFADPHSPWQRATNENTNGLLRQYFPKGTDLSVHSQMDLDLVANEMNDRPRRRLEFATPYEVLSEHLLQ